MTETVQKPEVDTILRCGKCGKTEQVNFQESLIHGWQKCCGQIMWLSQTTANIRKAVSKAREANVCIICTESSSHRITYAIPDGKGTTLSVLACQTHRHDLRDALKWYLVGQGLWYPNCIKMVDTVSGIEES